MGIINNKPVSSCASPPKIQKTKRKNSDCNMCFRTKPKPDDKYFVTDIIDIDIETSSDDEFYEEFLPDAFY